MSNDKTITIQCQGKTDYTVEGFSVNGMLAIPKDEDGVAYVTRAQAMDFFNLHHNPKSPHDLQLVKEVVSFLDRTPAAVRVHEDLGSENLAASFAVTLHKVLHEKVVEDLILVLKATTLALIESEVVNAPRSYNVVHKANAKPVGVVYQEVSGHYVFAPTNAGYWDELTLAEVAYALRRLNVDWDAQIANDTSISNG